MVMPNTIGSGYPTKSGRATFLQAAETKTKSLRGRKCAEARHVDDKLHNKTAVQYYNDNIKKFKSKNAAAEFMAENIVPEKYAAVRRWLSEPKT